MINTKENIGNIDVLFISRQSTRTSSLGFLKIQINSESFIDRFTYGITADSTRSSFVETKTELKQKTTSQQDLKSLLSKKRYEKLESYFFTELGFSIEILGKIKPFYLLSYTYKALVGCEKPISIEL